MKNYTSNELIQIGIAELKQTYLLNPRFEAETILAHLLNVPREYFLTNSYSVDENISSNYFQLIKKRKKYYPLQYIIGEWEFWSIKILVNENVLIPRQETETLIELCIKTIPPSIEYIIDLGTGSGNIAIALAKEFSYPKIIAIDISYKALTTASKNITLNNIKDRTILIQSNFLNAINYKKLKPPVLIISNPPYIDRKEIDFLPKEIKLYEPHISFFADNNGLQCYFDIINQLKKWKIKPIYLIFEIDPNLKERIVKYAHKYNFILKKVKKDYLNKERAILLKKC